ncbi:MAG TPA: sigma-70 family RNA polymerase sigma factor [Gemmataceae bacterium]|nr:sigma-70 family RNA polymerase sigma factor [Gemmataceae bacterium]
MPSRAYVLLIHTWLGRLTGDPTEGDWQQLLDVYGPLLRNWLTRSGVATADHEDLVQEVLLVIVRRVSEFDHRGPGAFRAWLRTILANHVKKYFRDRPDSGPALDLDAVATADSVLGKQWDREHDEFLAARALKMVEGDFAPATWAAFCRHVLDGRSPHEVATELGLSTNSVLLAKSRVLKRLRAELSGLVE